MKPPAEPRLPPLMRDIAFWGMTVTQFLGAFNDNFFKQLMLLLAIPVGSLASEQDQQWLATVVFSLPFVLFSGLAGFLSDRYSKRPIIIASKVAEIVVMGLGLVAFLAYNRTGYGGLLVVLFLMGLQSTFFGPGKYGILPEMLRRSDLPRANGIMLMTTFLAIIFGTATAGYVKTYVGGPVAADSAAAEAGGGYVGGGDVGGGPAAEAGQRLEALEALEGTARRLWPGSVICVVIAVLGTLSILLVRRVPAAHPKLPLRWSSLGVPPEVRHFLLGDLPLVLALGASCVFWLVGGIAMQAVNSLGRVQLGLDDLKTSLMTAAIGVGIAVGAVVTGRVSRGRVAFGFVRLGAWLLAGLLGLLAISLPDGTHLLGFGGSLLALIALGGAAGMFAIPLQVFIQTRPPKDQKGRMIAVMNQCNFVAILLSGVLYGVFDRLVVSLAAPRSTLFGLMMLLILPVAMFYRPTPVNDGDGLSSEID